MPCYHFTYHGYGTWLPDEDDGYVRRNEGQLPPDTKAAAQYRKRMTADEVEFDDSHQQAIIDEAQTAATFQSYRLHYIATEPTHAHILISWHNEEKAHEKLQASIRQSLSRRLSRDFGKRQWLSEGGSKRKVVNQDHYDYLAQVTQLRRSHKDLGAI